MEKVNDQFFQTMLGLGVMAIVVTILAIIVQWWHGRKKEKPIGTPPQGASGFSGCSGFSGFSGLDGGAGQKGQDGSLKPYSLDDLRNDLMNASISIDEIMGKCGHLDPDAIEKVVKEIGTPGDRRAERMAWYANMLRSNAKLKVVPPPVHQVVVAIKASSEVCKMCMTERMHARPGAKVFCRFCHDTGYVVIQRG